MKFFARTIHGIEWLAAAEIRATLGSSPTAVEHREVRFEHPRLAPEMLTLGTLDDVFAVVCEHEGVGHRREALGVLRRLTTGCDPSALLPALRRLRPVPPRPSFDVTATFSGTRNYNRYEIEEVVGSAVTAATGWRYETRSGGRRPPPTDVSLRVHLRRELTTNAIRVGAVPLHRRPYRQASRTASLRPPLARALALLAGLEPVATVLDPFCGAGTVPIEAALACPDATNVGFDIDPSVLALARANAGRARVDVRFEQADAAALPSASDSITRVITNPPWGHVVRASTPFADVWREIRRVLRADGRVALLVPSHLVDEAAAALALTPALRSPVRVLGRRVEIAVLSPDGALTVSGQLFERQIDDAYAPYADAPAIADPRW